jgi:hypothetical protein
MSQKSVHFVNKLKGISLELLRPAGYFDCGGRSSHRSEAFARANNDRSCTGRHDGTED